MTETEVKDLLRQRYSGMQYAFVTNVANSTGFASRYADGVAFHLWPSSGHLIEGFEIKVSRGDFLSELKQPWKSQDIMQYCDRWWLVAPKGVAVKEEIPKSWGFLEIRGEGKFYTVKPAPELQPPDLDKGFMAALLRRATQDVTPNEFLEAVRARIEEQVNLRAAAAVENEKKRADELAAEIERFEKEAGFRISSYSYPPEKVAKAIKFFLEDRNFSDWKVQAIRDALDTVQEALPYFELLATTSEVQKKKLDAAIDDHA